MNFANYSREHYCNLITAMQFSYFAACGIKITFMKYFLEIYFNNINSNAAPKKQFFESTNKRHICDYINVEE